MYKIALLVCMLVVATSIVVNAQAGGAQGLPLASRVNIQAQMRQRAAAAQRGGLFGGGMNMNNLMFYMMLMEGGLGI